MSPSGLYDELRRALEPSYVLKALGAGMRGMAHGHFGLRLSGGPLGLPGDFLIAPSGQIKAAKYGTHAYDQWSVDELIALAKGAPRAET